MLIDRPRWWILAALTLFALVQMPAQAWAGAASSTSADSGGVGVRLLDAPANTGADPRAQLYVVDHLAPGSVISRRIEITNTTRAPQFVSLYASSARIDNGQFVGDGGRAANDLSSWSSVRPSSVRLPPNGRATVNVTIAVPKDAVEGERYAAVWAEISSGSRPGIVQVNRVGIRLYVSVGKGGPPASDFTIDSLTAQRSPDGSPQVVASVRNTGGRALDLAGSLELLDGPAGLRAGPFAATLGSTLAIGASGHVVIVLDKGVPEGPWRAELTLLSGLLERRAEASITFPRSGSAPRSPATAKGPVAWPLLVAGLVILLLCVLVVVVMRRRRRR